MQAVADAHARADAIQAALDAEAAEAALIAQMYEGELSPDENDNNDVDPIWFDENVWAPPYCLANINARVPLPPSSPPEFVPGCGFATYPVRPALQASSSMSLPSNNPPVCTAPRTPLPSPRQCSPSPQRPEFCSPLLMVLCVKAFQASFPDYLVQLTLKEFGRPPYPKYL